MKMKYECSPKRLFSCSVALQILKLNQALLLSMASTLRACEYKSVALSVTHSLSQGRESGKASVMEKDRVRSRTLFTRSGVESPSVRQTMITMWSVTLQEYSREFFQERDEQR